MLFLNYKETDLSYIYSSSLRSIIYKQSLSVNNVYETSLPKVALYFVFSKVLEINLLKLSNHLVFF